MNVPEFQARWRAVTLNERQSAQPHFESVCALVGHQTPTELDPDGRFFAYEKGLGKTGGGGGFADVWYRRHFGWEYKKPGVDLTKAYRQLKLYAEALENPPLLIVSDIQRIEIHTNFTNTVSVTHVITLDDLSDPETFRVLRAAFYEPETLRPGISSEDVTVQAAARFGALAAALDARGEDPHRVAHFLMQLLFCLFAEDVGLLSRGIFTNLLALGSKRPEAFTAQAAKLFAAMRDGGAFGVEWITRFNGGLFATIEPVPLTAAEITTLHQAAALDWGAVEPAIFGTLFERSLDPTKRSQLGAHYTGRADIERVVEPVVMTPLRRRWDAVKAEAESHKHAWESATTQRTRDNRRAAFAGVLQRFQQELTEQRVLDPACGSGNFLYVALTKLLNLEKEVLVYGAANGLPLGYPLVSPRQLFGLEINEYARELAQVVVWIGYLQWRLGNGFSGLPNPILEPLETIKLQDALLDRSDPENPKEAEWPPAEFIIGNPPFLGGNKVRQELGDAYLADLFAVYDERVPRFADLVCYFFEKARTAIATGSMKRAGLLATQSIRMGVNRRVLDRIKDSGDIFVAWDDEPWTVDGASVRISIVGFDDGQQVERCLDGVEVSIINSDLTSGIDLSTATPLPENAGIAYQGFMKAGPFDIDAATAQVFLQAPVNPNGRRNTDVVFRWIGGEDLVGRPKTAFIIDFQGMSEREAALFQIPFEYVRKHVKPIRDQNRDTNRRHHWWLLGRSGSNLRSAINPLFRYVATSRVSKHRIFVWLDSDTRASNKICIFARQDDYFLGVLHSRVHEVWSLRMGSWHGVGNDPVYTPTTCFETFAMPWPPGQEPWRDPRIHAIANAASALDAARQAWLNPPDAAPEVLKKRTLTNLYNERPTWLTMLHADLDRAVWAAFGWDDPDPSVTPEDAILGRLLALNSERS